MNCHFPNRIECLDNWWLVTGDAVSGLCITFAYMAIPLMMLLWLRRASLGQKIGRGGMVVWWGAILFIFFCGLTHLAGDAMVAWWGWAYWLKLVFNLIDAPLALLTTWWAGNLFFGQPKVTS